MQRPDAPPRDHLTVAQVQALLASPVPSLRPGLELVDYRGNVLADLSSRLSGCTVTHELLATIHGSCTLRLAQSLRWGIDLLRPYVILSDGQISARFDQGVYVPITPRRAVGESVQDFDVVCYDLLYLLDRQVGATYSVAAGVGVLAAVETAIAASGLSQVPVLLDGTSRSTTVPRAMTWPLVSQTTDPDDTRTPVTWLRVVNDLLRLVNYRGLWADERGRFRSELYRSPTERAPEWEFTDLPSGVPLGMDRDIAENVDRVPNRWTFVASNPPEGVVPDLTNGYVWQYDLPPQHPLSAASRGLVWPERYEYDAATPAALKGLGQRRVEQDLAFSGTYNVSTRIFPLAGHADLIAYRDEQAGISRTVQATRSVVDLFGEDTDWTWEAVA